MLIGTYVCYVNANWRLSEQNSEPMEQDDGQPKSPQSEGQQLGESSISFLSTSSGQPMDTQLNPVRTHASVLLPADEFDVYKDDFDKPKSIITAAHLGKAVGARAEMELANWGDTTPLSRYVLVFNTLPIPEDTQPPENLQPDDAINLQSRLIALKSTTSLRDMGGATEWFYVLVTRVGQSTAQSTDLQGERHCVFASSVAFRIV